MIIQGYLDLVPALYIVCLLGMFWHVSFTCINLYWVEHHVRETQNQLQGFAHFLSCSYRMLLQLVSMAFL